MANLLVHPPLRTKVSLLVIVLTVLVASIITTWIFQQFDKELVARKSDQLSTDNLIVETQIKVHLEEIGQNVLAFAGMPPVREIIRESRNPGIESAESDGKAQLEAIFLQLLKSKTNYLQARLIGVEDSGKELVRVDRPGTPGKARVVPDAELQSKGGTEYFKNAAIIKKGEVSFSNFELNRENGAISKPVIPVVRASTPIFDDNDEFFGIIIINVNVDELFHSLSRLGRESHQLYITNARGDYLFHPDSHKAFGFEFGTPFTIQDEFPKWITLGNNGNRDQAIRFTRSSSKEPYLGYWRRYNFDTHSPDKALIFATSDTLTSVLEESRTVKREAIPIIIMILLVAIAIGLVFASWIARPISEIHHAMKLYRETNEVPKLPVTNSWDEAGQLAFTFSSLVKEINARNLELSETNRELERFAYMTSHDLQEPLRTITSYVSVLDKNYRDSLDPKAQKCLEFITSSATRMQALIQDLLALTKLGNSKIEFVETPLETMVDEILEDLSAMISQRNARVTYTSLPVLECDPVQMRQLYQNLIVNALKYQKPDVTPEITLAATHGNKEWTLSIADNGIGIDKQYSDQIFDVFRRLHRKEEYSGTGVGLAICKRIVNLHGGKIWVESEPGKGSTFHFTIPTPPVR